MAALSIQWSPTRVSRFSESGHTERNTHPFRIEGVKAAARKQEVRIPEKIRVAAPMRAPKREPVRRERPVLRSRRRRLAKEPDQNDFVYTLRHGFVLPPHRTGTCGTRDHLPYIHLTDNLGDASSHSCGDQSDVPQGIRADFRNRGSHFIDLPLQPPVVYSVAQVKTQTPRSPIC